MRILAIDTALPAISACVLDEGAESPESIETIAMQRGHAEALLPLIDRVMAGAEGGFASLDRVAVTVGPGSFTGLARWNCGGAGDRRRLQDSGHRRVDLRGPCGALDP